jgi:hypothetical protein
MVIAAPADNPAAFARADPFAIRKDMDAKRTVTHIDLKQLPTVRLIYDEPRKPRREFCPDRRKAVNGNRHGVKGLGVFDGGGLHGEGSARFVFADFKPASCRGESGNGGAAFGVRPFDRPCYAVFGIHGKHPRAAPG